MKTYAARAVLLVAGTLGFVQVPALAKIVTYNFTGTTTAGKPVQGTITYDSSQPPAYDTGSVAGYIQPPPSGMSVVYEGNTFQSSSYNSFQVLDNAYGIDNFNGHFTPIQVNGGPSNDSLTFSLVDSTQTVFSSTALPTYLGVNQFNILSGSIGSYAYFSIDTLDKAIVVTPVVIDIKPGSFPNSINPKKPGNIPVAILTTSQFDSARVDPTTVLFGKTGTEAAAARYALRDVDGDGKQDLILHFETRKTGIECGDASATLTGQTFDDEEIKGAADIMTVGCL